MEYPVPNSIALSRPPWVWLACRSQPPLCLAMGGTVFGLAAVGTTVGHGLRLLRAMANEAQDSANDCAAEVIGNIRCTPLKPLT